MTWQRWSVTPVWAAALVGAVLVAVYAGTAYLTWIPAVLGTVVLLAAAIQLAIQRKEGFVTRMAVSITGGVVILVIASILLAATHPGAPLPATLD